MAGVRNASGRFAPKAREDLSLAYRARIERAARKGLSLGAARGHGTRAIPFWSTKAVADREAYRKSLNVLVHMRHGTSLYAAARREHIAPDTVRRFAGGALVREPSGRYRATPQDRLYRRMRFLDERGALWVEVATSTEASKLAAYWGAVDRYLTSGDSRPMRRFDRMRLRLRDKSVRRFVTHPATLDRFALAGEVSFEDLYEMSA